MEEIKEKLVVLIAKIAEMKADEVQENMQLIIEADRKIMNALSGRITDLEFKVADLELEILKTQKNTPNIDWIPNKENKYWFVNLDTLETAASLWSCEKIDNNRLNYKVVFETEEEANEYLEYLLEKRKYMNTFTNEEWKNENIDKYYWIYNYENDALIFNNDNSYRENVPYFKSAEEAENFTEKYKWQIKHELGVK